VRSEGLVMDGGVGGGASSAVGSSDVLQMVMFGRGLKGCIRSRNVADEMKGAPEYGVG
jgi:hypothetical protein